VGRRTFLGSTGKLAEHPLHWTGFAAADLCLFLRSCVLVQFVVVLSSPASELGVRRLSRRHGASKSSSEGESDLLIPFPTTRVKAETRK